MHRHDAGCFMHTFPLFRFMRWYAYHACLCHPLALYASLHACLHVHAWVLLTSVSFMLQHNEAMDIRSKPTFVPHEHLLLFAFSLFFPFACLLASLLLCLPCLSCLSALCLFICSSHFFLPLLVYWFAYLRLCMYTNEVRTHEARAQSPRHKQEGRECKQVDISQATTVSRFLGLAFSLRLCTLLNPSFPPPFLL